MAKKKVEEDPKGQLEGILAELGKKIDQLISDTKGATVEVREEMEKKAGELRKRKDKIEDEFKAIRDRNEPKWTEARDHLNSAAGEIKKALDTLFKKKT